MTNRYFESMASKCLIVGHAPRELTDLFGYNPVIEVQEGAEFEQIEFLLRSPDSYSDLIEKNYSRLLQVGTWRSRVVTVLKTLARFRFDLADRLFARSLHREQSARRQPCGKLRDRFRRHSFFAV